MFKTTFKRLCTIVVVTSLLSLTAINVIAQTITYSPMDVVPNQPTRVRTLFSGTVTLIGAGTSTIMSSVANQRAYITQVACVGASSTALTLTLYDDGAGQNATNSGTYKMFSIPCTTSTTTGAYDVPVIFNPPLQTAIGDAVDVGVLTAANSTYVSVNGFRGTTAN